MMAAPAVSRTPPAALLAAGLLLAAGGAWGQAAGDESTRAAGLLAEARAYEHGEGVPRDSRRAVALYCEAARLGNAEAQFGLGWMYANGRGVVRDDALAARFFALAARQNHEHAQRMLRYVGTPRGPRPECLIRRTAAPGAPLPEEPFVPRTAAQKKVAELVHRLAPEYGISPNLALAVIRAESNFDPAALSPKNAQGLMQLIPATAARFKVSQPFDPVQNIRGGLTYLRWLLAYYRGDVRLVAAAYNAGEGAVDRHRGIPPFAETRAYVERILQLFGREEHPYDATITSPSPRL